MTSPSPAEVTLNGRLGAIAVLAWAEARSAAVHPVMLLGVGLSAWLLARHLLGGAAVWQVLSVGIGGFLLPLVAATFLVGAWSSSREIRYSYEEHFDSLAHGRTVRSLGILGGMIGPLAYVIGLVAAAVLVANSSSPAGEVLRGEIAVAPLAVGVAWAAGVAFRGAKRLRATPIAVLVVYAALQLIGSPDFEIGSGESAPGADLSRLLLWMPPSAFDTPFDLLMRPSGERPWFLVAVLLLLIIVVAVRTSRRLRLLGMVSVAIAVAAAGMSADRVLSYTAQQPWAINTMVGPRVNWELLTASQDCSTGGSVDVCPYPGFEPWAEAWSEVILRVQEAFPSNVEAVIQRPQRSQFPGSDPGPNRVATLFEWDRPGSSRPVHSFALASRGGHTLVGLPSSPADSCNASGQGRSVFPLWLASVSVDGGDTLVADVQEAKMIPEIEGVPMGGAIVDPVAVGLAQELILLDESHVRNVFASNWDRLVDPQTSVDDVAAWFELTTAPTSQADPNDSIPAFDRIPQCG